MVGPGQEVEWMQEGRKAEREDLIELLDELETEAEDGLRSTTVREDPEIYGSFKGRIRCIKDIRRLLDLDNEDDAE